jgi:uncharacterized repeat protein (TIGR01451 family)
VLVLLFALIASIVGTIPVLPTPASADSSVGSFEIDGNTPDSPSGEPTDWDAAATASPPVVVTPFTDVSGNAKEDGFGGNSHNNQPATWACDNVSTPAKDDIVNGKVGFRTIGGEQFVYVNFTREGTTGSVDLDYEFNQGNTPHPSASCRNVLPARTNGDLVIAFDQTGNDPPTMTLLKWVGDATTGSLAPVSNAPLLFQGAVNAARNFGEAALNLSQALGRNVACGEFSTVYMKSRASTSINSDLKDRTTTKPAALGDCPTSNLAKGVRNITTNPTGAFTSATSAVPGNRLEYRLTYTNTGAAPATNVVITDAIQPHQTFVSCTASCSGPTAGVLTWNLGTVSNVAGSNTVEVRFVVDLDETFAPGTSTVTNKGAVDTKEEPPKDSNTTTTTVTATAVVTQVKSANRAVANVGDQVTYTITYTNTGNAAGTVSPVDNYDEAHFDPSSVTDGGIDNGSTISWSGIVVPPKVGGVNGTKSVSYTGTVIGSFSGTPGAGCAAGQYPVLNTVTIAGESDTYTLCVPAAATITQVKTASKNPADIGDTVTYTVTYTNTGSAAGTVNPIDDYDQAHFDPVTITDGGNDDGDTIAWPALTVPAKVGAVNGTKSVSYTGTVIGTFTTGEGTEGCPAGQFPVENRVTNGDETDEYTLCVRATPSITQAKAPNKSVADVGEQVTYTITYTNTGSAAGTVSPVVDVYDPAHFDPTTISDGGLDDGSKITWTNVVVPPKGSKTLTYTGTVIGTFSGTSGTPPCTTGQYPVINTVTITGETDTSTLCVRATAAITQAKTASVSVAKVGDQVTYEISYVNTGAASGVVAPFDNYDEAHFDPTSVTDGGVDNGSSITWTGIVVPPKTNGVNGTKSVFYTGTVIGTYSGTSGTPPCTTGQYPVINTVTITGETDTHTLCVENGAILTITKTACPSTVVPGGVLTYTITVGNTGNAPATGVVITDTIPPGTSVVDAGGASQSGSTLTWSGLSVANGSSVSKTVKVLVDAPSGSALTNVATADADNAEPVSTGNVVTSVSNAGASTAGTGYAADANVVGLNLINDLSKVHSEAPGSPGHDDEQLLVLPIPLLVTLGLATGTSDSSVSDHTTSTAVGQVLGVNLLSGLVTADLVRGVSTSNADARFATSSSAGSTITSLVIGGAPITVAPNTVVEVRNPLNLLNKRDIIARVVVQEETKSASFTNGRFVATHSVNMIHLTLLKSYLGLPAATEIILGHADTTATYPSGLACGTQPGLVSGGAYNAWVNGTLPAGQQLANVQVGDAQITPLGGDDSDTISAAIPGVVTDQTIANEAHGTIAGNPSSWARSRVEGLNLLGAAYPGGLVTADVLDVRSTSTTTSSSATTAFATTFANVRIAGLPPLSVTPSPNSSYYVSLPTGGFAVIVVNEQLSSNGTKDTFGTVNALHVYLYSGLGILTAEAIVGHAHSDAHHP